jgi:hypothetical protein
MPEASRARQGSGAGEPSGFARHQENSLTSVTSLTPTTSWTAARVEERLGKAIALKAAFVNGKMPFASSRDDVVGMAMEAMSWLDWLETDDVGIVLARLEGAPWKSICWRFGISRPTADRRWRYALALIAWRLNGNANVSAAPSLRSVLGLRAAGSAK